MAAVGVTPEREAAPHDVESAHPNESAKSAKKAADGARAALAPSDYSSGAKRKALTERANATNSNEALKPRGKPVDAAALVAGRTKIGPLKRLRMSGASMKSGGATESKSKTPLPATQSQPSQKAPVRSFVGGDELQLPGGERVVFSEDESGHTFQIYDVDRSRVFQDGRLNVRRDDGSLHLPLADPTFKFLYEDPDLEWRAGKFKKISPRAHSQISYDPSTPYELHWTNFTTDGKEEPVTYDLGEALSRKREMAQPVAEPQYSLVEDTTTGTFSLPGRGSFTTAIAIRISETPTTVITSHTFHDEEIEQTISFFNETGEMYYKKTIPLQQNVSLDRKRSDKPLDDKSSWEMKRIDANEIVFFDKQHKRHAIPFDMLDEARAMHAARRK